MSFKKVTRRIFLALVIFSCLFLILGSKSQASANYTLSTDTSTAGKATFSWSGSGSAITGIYIWSGNVSDGCSNSNSSLTDGRLVNPSNPKTWSHQPGIYMAKILSMSAGGWVSNCAKFSIKTQVTVDTSTPGQAKFSWNATNTSLSIVVWDPNKSGSGDPCNNVNSQGVVFTEGRTSSQTSSTWSGAYAGDFKVRLATMYNDPYLSSCQSFSVNNVGGSITATVSGLNVNFKFTPQPGATRLAIWNDLNQACKSANDGVVTGFDIGAGQTTYPWIGAPPGTYQAGLVQMSTTNPFPVGCTVPFAVQTPKVILNIDTSTPGQAKFNWADPGVQVGIVVKDATGQNVDTVCQNLTSLNADWVKNPAKSSGEIMSWVGEKTFVARLVTYANPPWVSDCMPFTIKSVATPATNLKIVSQECQSDKTVKIKFHWDLANPAGGKVQNQWIDVTTDPTWNNNNWQGTSLTISSTEYTTGLGIPNLQRNTRYFWRINTLVDGIWYTAYYQNNASFTSASCQAVLWVDSLNYPNAHIAWTEPAEAGVSVPYYWLGVWPADDPNACRTIGNQGQVSGFPKAYTPGNVTNVDQQFPDRNYKAQLYYINGMIGDNGVSNCFSFSVKPQLHNVPSGWPTDQGYIVWGPWADGTSAGGLHGPVIDIITPKNALVKATMDGKVLVAGPYSGGYSVIIQNSNDPNFAYTIRYSHLEPSSLKVQRDDDVKFGQILAKTDCSGYIVGVDCENTSILHYLFDGFEMAPPYIPVTVPYACKSRTECNTNLP